MSSHSRICRIDRQKGNTKDETHLLTISNLKTCGKKIKNVKYCLSYGHFLTDFILIGGKVDIW